LNSANKRQRSHTASAAASVERVLTFSGSLKCASRLPAEGALRLGLLLATAGDVGFLLALAEGVGALLTLAAGDVGLNMALEE
jgi:hypothetical protein